MPDEQNFLKAQSYGPRGNWQLTFSMLVHTCQFLIDFAPELATGNWQLATHYLDTGSYLLVLKSCRSEIGNSLY
jgi:hypothetical protein